MWLPKSMRSDSSVANYACVRRFKPMPKLVRVAEAPTGFALGRRDKREKTTLSGSSPIILCPADNADAAGLCYAL